MTVEAKPSTLWQARVPKELSDAVTSDMHALGLTTRTEVLHEALTLFHRHAREEIMAREIDTYYGGEEMPLSPVVSAMFDDQETTQDSQA